MPPANPEPATIAPIAPQAGYNLKLTINAASPEGLRRSPAPGDLERAERSGKPATSGAFVAMDPLNGEILAVGSYPSFSPSVFAKPLTQSEYASLTGNTSVGEGAEPAAPLTDRATEGLYPTGSSFKPITAMAALEGGFLSPEEGLGGGQCIDVGGENFCNAGHADYGAVGLVEALKVSSDTYFFEVGERANSHNEAIQHMAHLLGIGEPTQIDLPSEIDGVVPNAKWREEMNALQVRCEHKHPRGGCGYVSEVKPWTVGENMDLAVGQGSLQTSPLQMATAYSTLVNAFLNDGNGWKVRPHLGLEVDDLRRRPRAAPQLSARAPREAQPDLPGARLRRHPQGRERSGRHVGRRVDGVEPGSAPRLREDGHGRSRRQARTVLVHVLRRRPAPADRDRRDRAAGRLRRRKPPRRSRGSSPPAGSRQPKRFIVGTSKTH